VEQRERCGAKGENRMKRLWIRVNKEERCGGKRRRIRTTPGTKIPSLL
jgi:hypothetical protein